MYWIRNMFCFFLGTIMYGGSLVVAMAGLKVGIEDTTIVAGNAIIIEATVDHGVGDIAYDWYIDGKPLVGVSTKGLDLSWEDYTSLFPQDASDDATRLITLEATDTLGTSSDTATLTIVHDTIPLPVCGDAYVDYVLGEECDDGNVVDGDGCDSNCYCEGMCLSLLARL